MKGFTVASKIDVGCKCILPNGIELEVVERTGYVNAVVQDQWGNRREVSYNGFVGRCLRWELDENKVLIDTTRCRGEYAVGDRFESRKHGSFEIIAVSEPDEKGRKTRTIKWEESGHITSGVSTERIRLKHVRDVERWHKEKQWAAHQKAAKKADREAVKEEKAVKMPRPKGHYVYIAEIGGDVVYVGKGHGRRYEHCVSGVSSCYFLNEAHFQGKDILVRIYKDGMSDDDALALEEELILTMAPKFNRNKNPHFKSEKSEVDISAD